MAGGNGTYVDVDDPNVDISQNHDAITQQVALINNYTDYFVTELQDSIRNLEDVVGTFSRSTESIDTSMPEIDRPSFPLKPTFGDLGLDTNWPDDLPAAPIFEEYGDMDFDYVAPTVPSEIDVNFDYSEDDYTSAMWTALFNKTHNAIINGGTGLTDAVHAAIVSREQEARRVNQDREYRTAMDSVGSRGFNLPSGQVASVQMSFSNEMLAKDQDSLNNIAIKDFELAQANSEFAVTSGVELEKLLRTTFDTVNSRGLEAQKAAKDYVIAAYSENVKLYLAKWDGIKIQLEALQSKIEAITSKNNGLTQIYLSRAQVFEAEINAITAKNTGIVDARTSEVNIYATEVDAVSKEYATLVEEAKVNVEATKNEVYDAIEKSKITLSYYTNKAALAERVAEAIANISAQSVASALGAINTSMSQGFSESKSNSEGWSHGNSITESHAFTEE